MTSTLMGEEDSKPKSNYISYQLCDCHSDKGANKTQNVDITYGLFFAKTFSLISNLRCATIQFKQLA